MAKSRFHPADLRGMLVPLATPFAPDETIDEAAFRLELRYMIGQAVHGLVVGSGAGEGFTLSPEELRRLVAIAAEEAAGRIPLLAGIVAASTRDAIARAEAVADLGVCALQVLPPHDVFLPDETAMLAHFRDIAEAAGLPVVIDNVVPWNRLPGALLMRAMAEVPGVAGVRQGCGDLAWLSDLVIGARAEKRVFGASGALVYPSLAVGAHGMIAQVQTALPGPCVRLWNLVRAGRHTEALDLHQRIQRVWGAIAADHRVAGTKYALSLQGVPVGRTRRPLAPPGAAQQAAVRAAIHLVMPSLELPPD